MSGKLKISDSVATFLASLFFPVWSNSVLGKKMLPKIEPRSGLLLCTPKSKLIKKTISIDITIYEKLNRKRQHWYISTASRFRKWPNIVIIGPTMSRLAQCCQKLSPKSWGQTLQRTKREKVDLSKTVGLSKKVSFNDFLLQMLRCLTYFGSEFSWEVVSQQLTHRVRRKKCDKLLFLIAYINNFWSDVKYR